MAEQNPFENNRDISLPASSGGTGGLSQFSLPPQVSAFLRAHQRLLWTLLALAGAAFFSVLAYTSYMERRDAKAAAALDAALSGGKDKAALLEKVATEYKRTPAAPWALIELSLTEHAAGQADKAISSLETARSMLSASSPLWPLVLNRLAVLYENGKHYDKALAVYKELAAVKAFEADAWASVGRVAEQSGKQEEALSAYKNYLEQTAAGPGANDPQRELVRFRLMQLQKK